MSKPWACASEAIGIENAIYSEKQCVTKWCQRCLNHGPSHFAHTALSNNIIMRHKETAMYI